MSVLVPFSLKRAGHHIYFEDINSRQNSLVPLADVFPF